MKEYLSLLTDSKGMKVLIIIIVLDVIFGLLRAIREKGLNSTIGIDGIIRKVGMIISIIFSIFIDKIVNINLVGFIPESLKQYVGKVGVGDLFIILYIIFEILSILKNMIKCKMPIPKKLQNFLEKLLKEFTSEIK